MSISESIWVSTEVSIVLHTRVVCYLIAACIHVTMVASTDIDFPVVQLWIQISSIPGYLHALL